MKQYVVLVTKALDFFTVLWGVLLIISAMLKIIDPANIMSTLLYFKKYYSLDINYDFIYMSVFIIIAIEIIVGALLMLKNKSKWVLFLSLFLTVSFVALSIKLDELNKLNSCGCFGPISNAIAPIHFIVLYCAIFILTTKIAILIKETVQQKISL